MNKKIKRERFNHNISPELIEQFEKLSEDIPCSKCVILEAALKCYLSLPRERQLLWTLNAEVQKIVKPNLISAEAVKAAREDEEDESVSARTAGVRKRKKSQHVHGTKSL